MGGYSGNTTFEFEIERWKNKTTGELLTSDQTDQLFKDNPLLTDELFEVTYEYLPIYLEVEGRSYYQPGRTWGPPESCYPDEGDTELISITDEDGNDWEDKLTVKERDSVMDLIQENVSAGLDGPDPDDYYDDYE